MEPFNSDVPDQRAWVVLGAFALRECAVGFDSHTLDYFRQKGENVPSRLTGEAKREYDRQWYQKNKAKASAWRARRNAELVAWWKEYKSTLCCEQCGFSHPATIVFHHRDLSSKQGDVSVLVQSRCSREKILAEVAKCMVLCANCHSVMVWNERYGEDEGEDSESRPDPRGTGSQARL